MAQTESKPSAAGASASAAARGKRITSWAFHRVTTATAFCPTFRTFVCASSGFLTKGTPVPRARPGNLLSSGQAPTVFSTSRSLATGSPPGTSATAQVDSDISGNYPACAMLSVPVRASLHWYGWRLGAIGRYQSAGSIEESRNDSEWCAGSRVPLPAVTYFQFLGFRRYWRRADRVEL